MQPNFDCVISVLPGNLSMRLHGCSFPSGALPLMPCYSVCFPARGFHGMPFLVGVRIGFDCVPSHLPLVPVFPRGSRCPLALPGGVRGMKRRFLGVWKFHTRLCSLLGAQPHRFSLPTASRASRSCLSLLRRSDAGAWLHDPRTAHAGPDDAERVRQHPPRRRGRPARDVPDVGEPHRPPRPAGSSQRHV